MYTIVTNKKTKSKNKKSLVAIINGTESSVIQNVLEQIPKEQRELVRDVSMDMARNMALAIDKCFTKSTKTIDCFHVIKLVIDVVQHIRIKTRWEVLDSENKAIKEAKSRGEKYVPTIFENGDTERELLARSRYLLFKYQDQWTENQKLRADILFRQFPIIEKAYALSLIFRNIYKSKTKVEAEIKYSYWKDDVTRSKIEEFNTVMYSLEYHYDNIMNFFKNRSTNAYAESFNSKIKNFRANLKGVTDVKFFLFRLEKLFA